MAAEVQANFCQIHQTYSSAREEHILLLFLKDILLLIYFSNIPPSESKVRQLARQKQIFTFHFARIELILLEARRLCFLIGLRLKEEKEKKEEKENKTQKSLLTLHGVSA